MDWILQASSDYFKENGNIALVRLDFSQGIAYMCTQVGLKKGVNLFYLITGYDHVQI